MKKNYNYKLYLSAIALVMISTFVFSACAALTEFFNLFKNPTVDDDDNNIIIEQPDTTLPEYVETDMITVDNSTLYGLSNVQITSNAITWDDTNEEELYAVYFSTPNDLSVAAVESIGFTLPQDISEGNDIYAFRFGTKDEQDLYTLSQMYYYNPDSAGSYTNNIYYFNGKFNDHYIQSQEELNHIMHYAYIYRIESFTTRFSDSFKNSILNKPGIVTEQDRTNALSAIVTTATQSFFETSVAQPSFQYNLTSTLTVTLSYNFYGAIEPTKSLMPDVIQDQNAVPYYESYSVATYTARAEEYDSFASDNHFITTAVETGEELFWAVESGATPTFTSTTSSAYELYQTAKDVLRQIIMPEMTEYEKVLSIFDYIVFSTIYDWKIVESSVGGVHPHIGTDPVTEYTSFYLEGVFYDGVAVCDGFSKALSLLANMEGIRTVRIAGYAGTSVNQSTWGGHAWNKVYLDEKWYVVDPTWTEVKNEHYGAPFEAQYQGIEIETLVHRYFLVSDGTIANTHEAHFSNNYKNYQASENYYIFVNGTNYTYTHNSNTYSLVIANSTDVYNLIAFLWANYNTANPILSIEIMTTGAMKYEDTYGNAVKAAKQALGFNNDILSISGTSNTYPYNASQTGKIRVVQIKDTLYNQL